MISQFQSKASIPYPAHHFRDCALFQLHGMGIHKDWAGWNGTGCWQQSWVDLKFQTLAGYVWVIVITILLPKLSYNGPRFFHGPFWHLLFLINGWFFLQNLHPTALSRIKGKLTEVLSFFGILKQKAFPQAYEFWGGISTYTTPSGTLSERVGGSSWHTNDLISAMCHAHHPWATKLFHKGTWKTYLQRWLPAACCWNKISNQHHDPTSESHVEGGPQEIVGLRQCLVPWTNSLGRMWLETNIKNIAVKPAPSQNIQTKPLSYYS